MREIKFRAWIYDRTNKRGKMYYAKDFGGSDASLFNYFSERGVDGEDFLMQSTGLNDKNGVDVWQGDKTQYGIVVWSEAEYAWAVIPKDDLGQLLYECSSDIEVIGHIHSEK